MGVGAPAWLADLGRRAAAEGPGPELDRYRPSAGASGRASAVLVLFGAPAGRPDLLFLRRSGALRAHPDEVCFPGGSVRDGDGDPARTALREAAEETGLLAAEAAVVATLPALHLAYTGYLVTPVLAWWAGSTTPAGDQGEIVSVHRVGVAALADPANRLRVRYPAGYISPGFLVDGLFIWGFTGSIVAWLLRLGGWARPWNTDRLEELPEALRRYGGGFGR